MKRPTATVPLALNNATPASTPASTSTAPKASPKKKGKPSGGAGMQLDPEVVQMPMSFPVQAGGPITPGTTNVDEPPATALPPPPPPLVGEPPWNPNEERTHDAYGFRYGGDGPRYRRAIDDEISLPDDQDAQVAEHEKNRPLGG